MSKFKIKRVTIILVLIIIAVLMILNPSPESFRKSLPLLTNLPNIIFTKSDFSKYSIYGRKNNFIICSIYTFDFNAPQTNGNDFIINLKVLGIAGNFFVINESRTMN